MASLLVKNISLLAGILPKDKIYLSGDEMSQLNTISNAYIEIKDSSISEFGKMEKLDVHHDYSKTIDAKGKMVLPAWCDSHTHLVFPKSREIEYIDKIKGLNYEEIAKRGGGILNSAKTMRTASEETLFVNARNRIEEMIRWGTGAIEIKSGYGLSTSSELKMLRVIKRLKEELEVTIKATFLGAHAIPEEYKNNRKGYVDLIVEEMLPIVAQEDLADFVDVFCDRGFFTVQETDKILNASAKYGLIPKIHANELGLTGGIQVGVKNQALSVDHLEYVGDEEINVLRTSGTMPTILPGAAFFLNMQYAPVRKMIEAGLPVAMATDFNPGSSPSGNMQLIISMGSILYKMLPAETLHAVTINSAYAMGVEKDLGSITIGKKANLIITKSIPSVEYIPYAYGENIVETMIINGEVYDR